MNTTEKTELLINTVKQYPVLYNTNHDDYKNVKIKLKVWNEVAKKIGERSGAVVKAKWRNLRDCYCKHLKAKVLKGPKNKHLSRYKIWPWTKQIAFLEPYLETILMDYAQKTGCTTNIKALSNLRAKNAEEGMNDEDSVDMEYRELPNPKLNTKSQPDQFDKLIKFLKAQPASEYDDIDLLFLGYAKTLKRFSTHRQILVKYEIAKLFMEAETEHIQDVTQDPFEALGFDSPSDGCDSPELFSELKADSENLTDIYTHIDQTT